MIGGRVRPVTMERRARRHEATRQEILEAAWMLARERGLTGWSLREVATVVGMRAPSLYVYFDRKDAIYDAMFADGYRALLEQVDTIDVDGTPTEVMRRVARSFFDFFVTDPARHQLLFLRIIPGFVPSEASYALATETLDRLRRLLAELGMDRPEAVDLWTALLTGMGTQQVSNDPGGQRWDRLLDDAVDMFLARELPS